MTTPRGDGAEPSAEFVRKIQPYKRRLEASYNEVKNICNEGIVAMRDDSHVDQFKGMFRVLDRYYTKFETLWDEIADKYDEAGISLSFPSPNEATMKANAQKLYYQANVYFEKLSNREPLSTSSICNATLQQSRIKNLPSIKVPEFHGDIAQWPKFRDIYISLVHTDDTISPSLKFQYLKAALTGPAASVIARFSIEDDTNYSLAWKAVTEAYDNRRMLASAYLNPVIEFKPLSGKTTAESLQSFRSGVSDPIAAFQLLKIANSAEFILFHLASRVLDTNTREQFEIANHDVDFPTFTSLDKYVKDRCLALQLASGGSHIPGFTPIEDSPTRKSRLDYQRQTKRTALLTSSSISRSSNESQRPTKPRDLPCIICNDGSCHHLLSCQKYDEARATERAAMLRNWAGCVNCLSPHHSVKDCRSRWHCRFCPERHHASLHQHASTTTAQIPSPALSSTNAEGNVLLGTAIAKVADVRGGFQTIRMVVDSASMYSFITKKCLDRLGLLATKCPRKISGIGSTIFEGVKGKTSVKLRPSHRASPEFVTDAVVVANITSYLPSMMLPIGIRARYKEYPLADPDFWLPRPVDFLLGADLFADICTGSMVSFEESMPKLLSSVFGHIVIGRYNDATCAGESTVLFSLSEPSDLNTELRRFWELEEPASAPIPLSPEDERCEEHFVQTHRRSESGQYIVRLPFRDDEPLMGDSTSVALKRFRNLERKLEHNPHVREKYCEFMEEYIAMDHMAIARTPPKFVIPHHCIIKEAGADIKLRVVFDGSVRVSPSSLNEQLLTGPKLQKDVRDILLGFRQHRYVFMTDAVKMFRMILVDEADWKYQNILWRSSPANAIERYSLKTVTYGLSCSPYLALRVMKQLCIDEGTKYPLASQALSSSIYVDDLCTGADTIEDICELQSQVINIMKCGGFSLSKWASNCRQVLQAISSEDDNNPVSLSDKHDQSIKILGLEWDPVLDCFRYTIKQPSMVFTKRAILSSVARIFDPIGFLTPVTLQLKAFIQDLWKIGIDWDTPIPSNLQHLWRHSVQQLPEISKIRIPRFINTTGNYSYQIIGFSDASVKAYCAAVYMRLQTDSSVTVFLLTAKSKLAPVKTLSVPRLELCAAFLLSDLFHSLSAFLNSMPGRAEEPVFCCDSTIVLGWLSTAPYQLKTFVCNRVVHINDRLPTSRWRHVRSEDNPADLGSRGVFPAELASNSFWWTGPPWLVLPQAEWPTPTLANEQELPELKEPIVLATTKIYNPFITWMSRFSSYSCLVRAVAWINRWRYNTKHVGCCCCMLLTGRLSLNEIKQATTTCIKAVQRHHFFDSRTPTDEIATRIFPNLAPYIDAEGVLRVGGRLSLSDLPQHSKHPILLPNNSHFSLLLVDHYHKLFLHPGPSQLQSLIQLRYWIPSLRKLVRKRGFLCIVCYKSKGKIFNQLMGNLPRYRLDGGQAFIHVGIDFAGPFVMRDSLRRKALTSKVYLCLYICMATKAIHLETVTRLTTDAFLAAFHRFISRRAMPSHVYSDNGSNFIGAARHLKELFTWFKDSSNKTAIENFANTRGIDWHFNPPQTPHMGGIWEAGVRSVKRRLRVIAGDTPMTFEELATLFARIEASLNSRPLCPVSDSPEDLEFLTPGHFLVGRTLCSFPEHSELDQRQNLLDRWQMNRRMFQQFWSRWRMEYLSTLQARNKWQRPTPNLQVGDLVLLSDESPPLQWPAARVLETHPGHDGLTRVVSLRTANGSVLRRHVSQCSPLLPLQEAPYSTEN